jgi:hypothetical protein
VAGCGANRVSVEYRIDNSISAHSVASAKINLGDSKEHVLSLLEPTQSLLSANERKFPDRYQQNGSVIEIFYFRSARHPDGFTTDDEFTPYIFMDGHLVAIGWIALGGPSSRSLRNPAVSTPSSILHSQQPVTQEGDRKVYDADECIGPVTNGKCRGTILPKKSYHPTCYGEWVDGRCTGPLF